MKVTNHNKGYESIPREVVYDTRLSFKARFLYVYMSCKPDKWEFHLSVMAKEIGCSVDTLKTYLEELVNIGWVVYEKQEQNEENGQFKERNIIMPNYEDVRDNVVTVQKKHRTGKNTARVKTPHGENTPTANNKEINNINKEIDKEIDKETLETSSRVKERLSHKYNDDKPLTDIEIKYYLGMEKNYPRVMRMDHPLLYRQYQELLKKGVNNNKIIANLEAMENYKPLKDRVKAYQTLLNFIKIDRNTYEETVA